MKVSSELGFCLFLSFFVLFVAETFAAEVAIDPAESNLIYNEFKMLSSNARPAKMIFENLVDLVSKGIAKKSGSTEEESYYSAIAEKTVQFALPFICRTYNKQRNHYEIVEKSTPNTFGYKLYIKNEYGIVSPFHDIPLEADHTGRIFNMIVEIPRWTNAKMEISKKLPLNPIVQDVKNDKLRFVKNLFPYKGYIWNYGAFPQTWENPEKQDEETGCRGDNDPLDVLDIGFKVAKRGEILKVKVLGAIALIDEGETDWKILVINVEDPIAQDVDDINDVEEHFPQLLKTTIKWLRDYKIPDGKLANTFAFDGQPKDANYALNVVNETHRHWKILMESEDTGGISIANTTLDNTSTLSDEKVHAILSDNLPKCEPNPLLPEDDKWYYIKDNDQND